MYEQAGGERQFGTHADKYRHEFGEDIGDERTGDTECDGTDTQRIPKCALDLTAQLLFFV
jgi:hypothetical protein